MRNPKTFVMALAVTLAAILFIGGAVMLHRNAKEPEQYAGGTAEINFDEGVAHGAGDAILIAAPKITTFDGVPDGVSENTDADKTSDGESDVNNDTAGEETSGKGGKGKNSKSNKKTQSASAVVTSARPDDVWAGDQGSGYSGFTTRAQLPAADSIGTLHIPSIGLTVNAYDSADDMEAMNKGISHFSSTSYWDGNCGFAGHNGNLAYSFFGKLHKIKVGDTITYTTELGTRSYTVSNIWTISDDDWSHLERTDDNRLTLITCVADASKRLCVQAVEQ